MLAALWWRYTSVTRTISMSARRSIASLAAANAMIILGLFVFATGFFPYKTFIPGRASYEDDQHGKEQAHAPFDKVIFMVVDALRRFGIPALRVNHSQRRQ